MRRVAVVVALALVAACADDAPSTSPAGDPPGTSVPPATSVPPTDVPSTADAVPTTADVVSSTAPEPRSVDEVIAAVLATADVPGSVVAVIRDGEIVATVAHGIDPASGEAIEDDELFQVGSISKPVTAMAVAVLVERGVLDWDDDVRDHLTSFTLRSGYDEPVTIARLLSHTGGINVDGFVGYPAGADVPSVPAVLAGEGNSPEVFVEMQPGLGYSYSGGGYTLLQQALVDATGTDFASLVDELVLGPADTAAATFAQPLPPGLRARATAGSIGGNAVEPFVYPEQAAAGLWAGAPDLGRLLIGFQQALRGEAPWLGAEAARYLVEPTSGYVGQLVGHGFFVDAPGQPGWFWHTGRNTGYQAEIMGSVDGRHGLVIVTNALDAQATIAEVIDAVATAEGWDPPLR